MKMNTLPIKENLKKYTRIDECPIRNVLAHFSGKWPILILCVLADTLKHLETYGLIARTIYPEVPPRVEYALTDTGRSLMPILGELIAWSLHHFDHFQAAGHHA